MPRKSMGTVDPEVVSTRIGSIVPTLPGEKKRIIGTHVKMAVKSVQVPACQAIRRSQIQRLGGGTGYLVCPKERPASITLRVADGKGRHVGNQRTPANAESIAFTHRGEIGSSE